MSFSTLDLPELPCGKCEKKFRPFRKSLPMFEEDPDEFPFSWYFCEECINIMKSESIKE